MVREAGLDVNIMGTSNFQAIGLYNKLTGFGGVTNFLHIYRGDIDRLAALQVEVAPFVRDRRSLEVWSQDFFLHLIERIEAGQ